MMIKMKALALIITAFAVFFTFPTAQAATAAGAAIEVDGKYIGGYVITRDDETRIELVWQLTNLAPECDYLITATGD